MVSTRRRIFPKHLWDHDARHVAQMLPEPIGIPPFAPKIQLQEDGFAEFLDQSHRVIAPALGDTAGQQVRQMLHDGKILQDHLTNLRALDFDDHLLAGFRARQVRNGRRG